MSCGIITLPLISPRSSASASPSYRSQRTSNRLTLAFDAVHPKDDYESYNFGAEDRIRVRGSTGIAVRTGVRTRSYGNEMTAGLGLFWSSRRKSTRCEAGYSWMEESLTPDRHGLYLRLYR